MSKQIFNPLVALGKKPDITSIPLVKIYFPGEKAHEGEDNEEEIQKPKIMTVKIVNKRKGPEYREEILKRLYNKPGLPFVEITQGMKIMDVSKEEEKTVIEPVKKNKKLVIRDVTHKIEPEKEKIEKEPEEELEKEPEEEPEEELEKEPEEEPEEELEEKPEEELEKKIKKVGFKEELKQESEEELKEELEKEFIEEEKIPEKKKRGRKPKIIEEKNIEEPPVDLTKSIIRTQKVADRLPKEREKMIIPVSNFYMNNRKMYIQKLSELFKDVQKELTEDKEEVSCDTLFSSGSFDLLTHQKIAREYLNLYTPYRGLLLYLGLGSGKSCTSIAVAEGMKSEKKIFILTPASLKMNFFTEMKKCGDALYKRNQFWEFISIEGNPTYINILATALSLSSEYIRKKNGAWLVNINKSSNYSELSPEDQRSLDEQINEMIRTKYTDINYNGIRMKGLKEISDNLNRNPFDNSVVIIDEAHNFVSRIVNKLKKPKTIPNILYRFLLSAKNARIVLLTGTPVINYPNEVGILFNILRGYITTWTFPINVNTTVKVTTDTILELFEKENFRTYDYVNYAGNKLTITRNPYGFINMKKRGVAKGTKRIPKIGGNKTKHRRKIVGGAREVFDKYDGVHLNESGNITDEEFQNRVISILNKNGLQVQQGSIVMTPNKALPDDPDDFMHSFINPSTSELRDISLFQRRILGLTSYYRSSQETLLPEFVTTEEGDDYHIEKVEMSSHQFGIYEKIRKIEADKEKISKMMKNARNDKKIEDLFNISSTYRIFSRAACNFVFPSSIERPLPDIKDLTKTDLNENIFDNVSKKILQDVDVFSSVEDEDAEDETEISKYEERIKKALEDVSVRNPTTNESEFLSKPVLPEFSPKFAKVLENLQNPENEGLHLVYSHFRTIEGIGILKLILEANGFAEFVIKKNGDNWEWIENEADIGKPNFVLYTGTETPEEKEIKRNVYNSAWDVVPNNIANKLRERNENNFLGEIIKIFMITSSGAEGINLKNTRFVHIVEPYWHMVRIDQVVGRARRICSHQDLPLDMRNVKVYLYVTTFSEQQKTDEKNIELRIRDISRIDNKTPVTTDESLYEIASIKQKINNQILKAIKETAIDCQLYANANKRAPKDKDLVCYGFGKVESNQFSYYPNFEMDENSKEGLDVTTIQWEARKVTINGIDYALNEETMDLYDYQSYIKAKESGTQLLFVGKLVKKKGKYVIEK